MAATRRRALSASMSAPRASLVRVLASGPRRAWAGPRTATARPQRDSGPSGSAVSTAERLSHGVRTTLGPRHTHGAIQDTTYSLHVGHRDRETLYARQYCCMWVRWNVESGSDSGCQAVTPPPARGCARAARPPPPPPPRYARTTGARASNCAICS